MKKEKKIHAKKACVNCQKTHRKCENVRPCNNCKKNNRVCYDVQNKKRKNVLPPINHLHNNNLISSNQNLPIEDKIEANKKIKEDPSFSSSSLDKSENSLNAPSNQSIYQRLKEYLIFQEDSHLSNIHDNFDNNNNTNDHHQENDQFIFFTPHQEESQIESTQSILPSSSDKNQHQNAFDQYISTPTLNLEPISTESEDHQIKMQSIIKNLMIELDSVKNENKSLKYKIEILEKSAQIKNDDNSFPHQYKDSFFPYIPHHFLPFITFDPSLMYCLMYVSTDIEKNQFHPHYMYLENVSPNFAKAFGYLPSQMIKKNLASFSPNFNNSQLQNYSKVYQNFFKISFLKAFLRTIIISFHFTYFNFDFTLIFLTKKKFRT